MNPLLRAGRKARYLWQTWAEERLLAQRLVPALAPAIHRPRRRPRPDPAAVGSVLVWNVDSLGDFLWVTPALRALRAGYPRAEITLVCNRACRSLAETNPHVDRVVPVDPAPFYRGTGVFRGVPALAGSRFDVMLILEMGARPADAGRVLGRRIGAGYVVSSELGFLKGLPDHTLPPNAGPDRAYWPSYFLRAVEHLGLPTVPPRLEVFPTAEDERAAAEALGPEPASEVATIGFHPCVAPYALLTKKWPDESFVALAARLAARRPTRFVLTGSPDEAEACERLAARIRESTGAEARSAAGKVPIRAMVPLLRRLHAYVVGDTSALHLAAAAGTPTVALFGATDDRVIAPPLSTCTVLNRHLPCSPCVQYRERIPLWPTCLFDHPKCMDEILPDHVDEAVEDQLARAGGPVAAR